MGCTASTADFYEFYSVQSAANFLHEQQEKYLHCHSRDQWLENGPRYKIRLEGDIPERLFYSSRRYPDITNSYSIQNVEEVFLVNTKSIGNYAFSSDKLEKCNFPDCLEFIGDYAFGYNKFTGDLILPDSITHIGTDAFYGADVDTLKIPSNMNIITKEAFRGCKIKTIIFPPNLIEIEDEGLACCDLKEITIPSTVKKIGNNALRGNDFEYLEIPGTVEKLGKEFAGNRELHCVKFNEGFKEITEPLFSSLIENVVIEFPNSLSVVCDDFYIISYIDFGTHKTSGEHVTEIKWKGQCFQAPDAGKQFLNAFKGRIIRHLPEEKHYSPRIVIIHRDPSSDSGHNNDDDSDNEEEEEELPRMRVEELKNYENYHPERVNLHIHYKDRFYKDILDAEKAGVPLSRIQFKSGVISFSEALKCRDKKYKPKYLKN